jgi:hypothetical protein
MKAYGKFQGEHAVFTDFVCPRCSAKGDWYVALKSPEPLICQNPRCGARFKLSFDPEKQQPCMEEDAQKTINREGEEA